MRAVFADTFFYLALLSKDDAAHLRAARIVPDLDLAVVTTAWVLTEVADAFCEPGQRGVFMELLKALRVDPDVTLVPPNEEVFEAGLDLYGRRSDKDWSLTDCISFVVMERHGLSEALTADHHFEQAGFKNLL